MKRFTLGARVLVHAVEATPAGVLHFGKLNPGRVVRLRRCDNGAFVELDARADDAAHPFPSDDTRGRHVLTFPEYCDKVSP